MIFKTNKYRVNVALNVSKSYVPSQLQKSAQRREKAKRDSSDNGRSLNLNRVALNNVCAFEKNNVGLSVAAILLQF